MRLFRVSSARGWHAGLQNGRKLRTLCGWTVESTSLVTTDADAPTCAKCKRALARKAKVWCFTCGEHEATHVDVLDTHPTMGCCGGAGCCVLVDVAGAAAAGWWRGPMDALGCADDAKEVAAMRPCESESDDERSCRLPHGHSEKHTDGFKEWPCGHSMHDDDCTCGHETTP